MSWIPRIVGGVLLSVIAGCVTSPIPANYTGPTTKIVDTSEMETSFRAAYFYVSELNDKPIQTNLDAFRAANRGRGFSISAGSLSRLVPAGVTKLKLEGRNVYGAPIQELIMAATVRSVTEFIEVELKPDEIYHVRGVLGAGKDEVWLELHDTGERVGRKLPPQ
jgi:hypothetical protein